MEDLWRGLLKWLLEEPGRIAGFITGIIVAITAALSPFVKLPLQWIAVRSKKRVDDFTAMVTAYQEQIKLIEDSHEKRLKERDDRLRFLEHERNNWEARWIARQHLWDKQTEDYERRIEELQTKLEPWPELPDEDAIVIIAEDEKQYADYLVRLLAHTSLGYKAFVVKSGQDALRYLRQYGQFKLMTVDFGLPDIDGVQVAIQARREGFDLPIIGISGGARYMDKDDPEVVAAQFVDIIPKTTRAAEIAKIILKVLGPTEGDTR